MPHIHVPECLHGKGLSYPKDMHWVTQAGPIGIYLVSLMYSQRLGCHLPGGSLQS